MNAFPGGQESFDITYAPVTEGTFDYVLTNNGNAIVQNTQQVQVAVTAETVEYPANPNNLCYLRAAIKWR